MYLLRKCRQRKKEKKKERKYNEIKKRGMEKYINQTVE
jgi:hypothetical protein